MKRPPLEDVRQMRRDLQTAFIDSRKDKAKDDTVFTTVVACLQLLDWIVDGRETASLNVCRDYIAQNKRGDNE